MYKSGEANVSTFEKHCLQLKLILKIALFVKILGV